MTRYARALVAPIFLIFFTGCAAWVQPVETAQTVEQKAFAVYSEYAIAASKAANVAEDPATPQAVRKAILSGLKLTAPVAKGLKAAVIEAVAARQAVDMANLAQPGGADPGTLAKLDVATGALQRFYDQARPQLQAFQAEFGKL